MITVAEELIQNDLTLTRRAGESVSFSCGETDQCSSAVVYWYQKKDTRDLFRMLLSIGISNGAINRGFNHPQQNDFSAVKNQGSWALELKTVKDVHSAIYYCSCYKSTHSVKSSLQAEQKPSEEKQETTAPSQSERQQLEKISVCKLYKWKCS